MIFLPYFFEHPKDPSLLKADSTLLKVATPVNEKYTSTTRESLPGQQNQPNHTDHFSSKSQTDDPPLQFDPKPSIHPFSFDPNTLDQNGWKKLGLPDRTINTILNYRSKGGRFYKKEDLQKIWGLPEGFYQYVEAFIQITPANNANYTATSAVTYPTKVKREWKITTIDINQADTSAFIALPGIGSKLAFRIINFRDKLGGFQSIDQVGETYGLPDSTFQRIRQFLECPEVALKKIYLNTATKDELKLHPYIRWNLANAIVEYRNQHGNFNSLEELKKISLIDEATFKKILPYLSL
jgi:competence ComEA-like helix-hairpin-helix protein